MKSEPNKTAPAPLRRRPKQLKPWLIFLAGLLVMVALFGLANTRHIVFGLTVEGIKLGGLSPLEAEKVLTAAIGRQSNFVTFRTAANRRVTVPRSALPLHTDAALTATAAAAVGHQPNIARALRDQFLAITGQLNMPFSVTGSTEQLPMFINRYLNSLETPVVDATVAARGERFVTLPSQSGILIDAGALTGALTTALARLDQAAIDVELKDTPPRITTTSAEAVRVHSQALADRGPYKITVPGDTAWIIDKTTLASWFVFPSSDGLAAEVDTAKIADFLAGVAPSVSHPAVNAVLQGTKQGIEVKTPDIAGVELNVRATADLFRNHVLSGNQVTDAVIISRPALIRGDNLVSLGLTSRLAEGQTDFGGSSQSRSHNISVGAARFNNLLIGPGETFSFNERLGDVSPDQGYLPELVIKGDKTIPEYGGGLCQVSTTLFRAAVEAGLAIPERQAHSYVVRYYNPIGFDATIYPPYTDLKIKNNTAANIYLQSTVAGTKIRFEIFGTNDGRRVNITGPAVIDRQPDGAMKAVLTEEVLDSAGGPLYKKTFNSNYKSPALYPVIRNPLE